MKTENDLQHNIRLRERSLEIKDIKEAVEREIRERQALIDSASVELESMNVSHSKLEEFNIEAKTAQKAIDLLLAFRDNLSKWELGEVAYDGNWENAWKEIQKKLGSLELYE